MKKKLLSLAMALAMCLGLCVPAFAGSGTAGAPSEEELAGMVEWSIGGDPEECYVAEPLELHYSDGDPMDCDGYYNIAPDAMITVTNNSTRMDCGMSVARMAFENDGTGVYKAVWGDFFKRDNDEIAVYGPGAFLFFGLVPNEFRERDIVMGLITISLYASEGEEGDMYTKTTFFKVDKGNGPSAETPAETESPAETPSEPEAPAKPAVPAFTDVPASAYYAEPVAWAVEKEITTGTSATAFSPKQDCTNAQILTFLWRACGKPEVKADRTFTDSVADAYVQAILWAYEQGMVTGAAFDASQPCTRAMAVTYIWKACGSPAPETTASFTDVPADADHAQAVAWAVEKGVTTGTGDTTFSPDEVCNRGQIVTFLHRAMG